MAKITKIELINTLKESGLRVTETRIFVLETIIKSSDALSIYEITEKIRKKNKIDQATVYRNALSLEAVGIVRKTSLSNGSFGYEITPTEIFCRFVCARCGITEKIKDSSLNDLVKKNLKKNKKIKIDTVHSIEFSGLCKKCLH